LNLRHATATRFRFRTAPLTLQITFLAGRLAAWRYLSLMPETVCCLCADLLTEPLDDPKQILAGFPYCIWIPPGAAVALAERPCVTQEPPAGMHVRPVSGTMAQGGRCTVIGGWRCSLYVFQRALFA